MSSSFDADEVSRVSNSNFVDGDYHGFDSHISGQSYGSYAAFGAEEDDNGPILISTNGIPASVFPHGARFVHEDGIPHSPKAYEYRSDEHLGFNSGASPFTMPDSSGIAYAEEVNGEVFVSNGPILPPPSQMHPDESFFLREWRRQNLVLLEEKERVEKEVRNQIIIEAEEYKNAYHEKRKSSCATNKIQNREKEKVFVDNHEKFHANADKHWWKAIAELIPNEVSKIEKRGKREQAKASTSVVVVQGPKPGKPTDLSRMRQLLVKLKNSTPSHMDSVAAPPPPAPNAVAAAKTVAPEEVVVMG